jgi:hypothetical protein
MMLGDKPLVSEVILSQWGVSFIELINRRLEHNLVQKPCYLFLDVDHVC